MPASNSDLHAAPGDRLVIAAHHQGDAQRDAEILDVVGDDGAPPYVVRWEDDGRVSRIYPGSDGSVEHFEHPPSGR